MKRRHDIVRTPSGGKEGVVGGAPDAGLRRRRAPLRRLAAPSLVLAALLAAGCGDRAPPAPAVTDSAGVRISLAAADDRVFAVVAGTPLLSLGGADVEGPTRFSGIRGIAVHREGRILVADGGSAELRIFRPDGGHLGTVGGSGEGPGEFRRIRLLGTFRGDSVALWDDRNPRLTVLDGTGALAGAVPAATGEEAPPLQARDVFPDGAVLALRPRIRFAGSLEAGEVLGDTAALVRADLRAGTVLRWGTAPGPLWVWTGRSQVPVPFTVNAAFALVGEALHLAAGPDFRIRVLREGRLEEVYGVRRPPREADREAVEAYRRTFEEAIADPARLREYLSPLDHPRRPELLPAYHRLVAADDGTVWARVYAPDLRAPAGWDVYAPDGGWLGGVETPAGFSLEAVSGGKAYGVWRDGLGVEHVRVYRIVTGPGRTASGPGPATGGGAP